MKENISYQEKQTMASLFNMVVILVIYSLIVYQWYVEPNPEIIHDFKFWGKTFLILIPLSIVGQIILHIIFHIILKIATREDFPTFSDERDKLIELKAIRISHWVFIIGFFISMASQAMGMQPWIMFVTLISSGFLAAFVSGVAKVYFYRKGI